MKAFLFSVFLFWWMPLSAETETTVTLTDIRKLPSAGRILELVAERMESSTGWSAKYRQFYGRSQIQNPDETAGRLFARFPNLIRVDQEKPVPGVITLEDDRGLAFFPGVREAIAFPVARPGALGRLLIPGEGWLQEARKHFEIELAGATLRTILLRLKPARWGIKKHAQSIEMEILSHEWLLRSVTVTQSKDEFLKLVFSDIRFDEVPSEAFFQVVPPERTAINEIKQDTDIFLAPLKP